MTAQTTNAPAARKRSGAEPRTKPLTDGQPIREITPPRGSMPSLARIQGYWAGLGLEIKDVFPDLRAYSIGWGEPSCFRCGWLAPSKEAADYSKDKPYERRLRLAWNATGSWLERAHLHDHAEGGDEAVSNLVPLCPLCHDEQPICASRDAGIAFVNSDPALDQRLRWYIQMYTDGHYRERRPASPADARRLLVRAQADVATQMLKSRDEL